MDKHHTRVHVSVDKSRTTVYTPKPKELQAQIAARRSLLSGSLLAGGFNPSRVREFIVAYYNLADLTQLRSLLKFAGDAVGLETNVETASDSEMQRIDEAAEELRKSRPRFKAAVKWLCSQKSDILSIEPTTSDELERAGITLVPKSPTQAEQFLSYFEKHGLRHFKLYPHVLDGQLMLHPDFPHCVDVLCAFLLDVCHRLPPAEFPLKVCRRCEKLFVSHKRSTEYCSPKCRENAFWTRERRADYNKVIRWEKQANDALNRRNGYTLADLERLKKITSRNNSLDNIKSRWKDWPKITEKIQRIRGAISKGAT